MPRNHEEIFDAAFVAMYVAEVRSRNSRVDNIAAVLRDPTFRQQTRAKAVAVAEAAQQDWIDHQKERFGVKPR